MHPLSLPAKLSEFNFLFCHMKTTVGFDPKMTLLVSEGGFGFQGCVGKKPPPQKTGKNTD